MSMQNIVENIQQFMNEDLGHEFVNVMQTIDEPNTITIEASEITPDELQFIEQQGFVLCCANGQIESGKQGISMHFRPQ